MAAPSWKGWALIAGAAALTWLLEPRGGARVVRRNPRRGRSVPLDSSPELSRAAREWESFHWGRSATKATRVKVPARPETLVKLGDLVSVTYRTRKGDEPVTHYEHEFAEEGGKKPTLALDPRTRRLHVVGGTYTVGWRGIIG